VQTDILRPNSEEENADETDCNQTNPEKIYFMFGKKIKALFCDLENTLTLITEDVEVRIKNLYYDKNI